MKNALECVVTGMCFGFGIALAAVILKTIFHFQLLT